MGVAKFPIPEGIEEIITWLNRSTLWNLTLLEEDKLYIYDGDQPMFITSDRAEVFAFLAGCFLSTYFGNDFIGIEGSITRYQGKESSEEALRQLRLESMRNLPNL
jgi:hypothetical protein